MGIFLPKAFEMLYTTYLWNIMNVGSFALMVKSCFVQTMLLRHIVKTEEEWILWPMLNSLVNLGLWYLGIELVKKWLAKQLCFRFSESRANQVYPSCKPTQTWAFCLFFSDYNHNGRETNQKQNHKRIPPVYALLPVSSWSRL